MLGLPDSISALLFDLDGVLTTTAALHERAWKQVFDEYLQRRSPGDRPFSHDDYLDHVDGRSRDDGIRQFLESRQIEVDEATVHDIGERKNRLLLSLIERDGVAPFDGSVKYLSAVRDAGFAIGVVTSSANGRAVLDAADLSGFVDARIDGVVIAERKLRGKPAPDAFLAGADALGVGPDRAAVFEDAVAGVQAGHDGHFGYVVGVNRGDRADDMRAAGADVVVDDLADLLKDDT